MSDVFIVRMRGDAHHRPGVLKIEKCLVERYAIFGCRLSGRRLLRTWRIDDRDERNRRENVTNGNRSLEGLHN